MSGILDKPVNPEIDRDEEGEASNELKGEEEPEIPEEFPVA